MTFTLRVDGVRWMDAMQQVRDEVNAACGHPGALVPVAKGDGYGFGMAAVCQAAAVLGAQTLAVETPFEALQALQWFDGDVLVMQPWEPAAVASAHVWAQLDRTAPGRVVRTIAGVSALHDFAASRPALSQTPGRIVLDGLTSLWRRGFAEPDLDALLADSTVVRAISSGLVRLEGLALNLPVTQPSAPQIAAYQRPPASRDSSVETAGEEGASTGQGSAAGSDDPAESPSADFGDASDSGRFRESLGWALTWLRALAAFAERAPGLGEQHPPLDAALDDASASTWPKPALWISHAEPQELRALHEAVPSATIYARVGRDLWLQHQGAAVASGTVLAVHPVSKGQPLGHSQRRAPRDGLLLAVAGGSHHGVAADTRTPGASWRKRMTQATLGALEATGRLRSPFLWDGKPRWFVEAPDTHVSLILLTSADLAEASARGCREPGVGDELICRVPLDRARFDQVVFEPSPTGPARTEPPIDLTSREQASEAVAWTPPIPAR